MRKSLASLFEIEIRPRLEEIGFVCDFDKRYSIPIKDGRSGTLTMYSRRGGARVQIEPRLSVGDARVSRYGAKGLFEGWEHSMPTPMFSVMLSELTVATECESEWSLGEEADLQPTAEKLAAAVARVGLPYLRTFASDDELIDALRERPTQTTLWDLPIALTLAGRLDEAREEIRRGLASVEGMDARSAGSYRWLARQIPPDMPIVGEVSRPERGGVLFSLDDLLRILAGYEEDDLIPVARGIGPTELKAIGELAQDNLYDPTQNSPAGSSVPIDKAIALAAVETLEGASRSLRRARWRSGAPR